MKKNVKFNVNVTTLIMIGIAVLFVFGGGFSLLNRNNNRLKAELQQERNLVAALNDSLRITTNKYGEVVNEKLTLQTSFERLEELNDKLTEDQRELLRRLRATEREKSIINAALIRANIIIDSLLHEGSVDVGDSIVTFTELENPDIRYVIDVLDVMPVDTLLTPRLLFRNLNIPNDTYVEFSWDDNKREGYPISFSVTNTNRYLKVHNIESYAIPALQKEDLDPNAWQQFTQWLDRTGGTVGKIGIGAAIGFSVAAIVFN